LTACLAACGGSEKPAQTAVAKPIIPVILPPASAASAPAVASTPAAPVTASAPTTMAASEPVAASAPESASMPAASGPESTPVINIDVYGDDSAMGLAGYNFGMPIFAKPAAANLQDALQKQFDDTGIKVANHASGGTSANLMDLLDGMDGSGAPFAQRLAATQSTIVMISYGLNEQYGGETVSDFSGYLAQAIQTVRDAGRRPILETPSPTCDSDHPFTASYAAAIKVAGATYDAPVVDNYAAISDLSGWRDHMDQTCTLPDEALQAFEATQELTVIAPLVKTIIGDQS
jgi:hypothetical protein